MRDPQATVDFYGALGFGVTHRDDNWLILQRGGLVLEFFPFADLDPAASSFSCCLRLDDLDAFVAVCRAVAPVGRLGWPRLHQPAQEKSGLRIAYLVDPDGSLLRLVQNPA